MSATSERRREERLRYQWPVWFADDNDAEIRQGQMADVSSQGAAFTCYTSEGCPSPGQQMTARFSIPRHGEDGSFDMVDVVRSGSVHRVDFVNDMLRRVAICFAEPLPFHPADQAIGVCEPLEDELEPMFV